MIPIGARRTPAFQWKPSHWSIGPFLLFLAGMATLFLIRVLVKNPQAYSSTVGFVIPFLDLFYILGAVLATLMSGGELKDLGITRRYGLLALAVGLLVGFAIMGVRSLDPRYAGYLKVSNEVLPGLVLVFGGAFHAFAEEVLFRGYMMGRLSRDIGWVPGILISGIAYGLMPFAFLGADPTAPEQILEISRFFGSVFPAMLLLGVLLALVYRIVGNIICPWFGVTLSIWTLGFIKGGIAEDMSNPLLSLAGYICLIILTVFGIRLLLKAYGKETISIKEIKNIVD